MASKTARDAFRDSLQAAFPAVTYVESIATRVDTNNLPALWMSLEFLPGGSENAISIGKPTCYRESGVVRVWVVGSTGSGDGAAIDQADAVAAFYRGWSDDTVDLRVVALVSPSNNPESDGRWFLSFVDLTYQLTTYV